MIGLFPLFFSWGAPLLGAGFIFAEELSDFFSLAAPGIWSLFPPNQKELASFPPSVAITEPLHIGKNFFSCSVEAVDLFSFRLE